MIEEFLFSTDLLVDITRDSQSWHFAKSPWLKELAVQSQIPRAESSSRRIIHGLLWSISHAILPYLPLLINISEDVWLGLWDQSSKIMTKTTLVSFFDDDWFSFHTRKCAGNPGKSKCCSVFDYSSTQVQRRPCWIWPIIFTHCASIVMLSWSGERKEMVSQSPSLYPRLMMQTDMIQGKRKLKVCETNLTLWNTITVLFFQPDARV